MKRILFVDDEPAILEGLRDRLRRQRREWEMVFALGGEEAIAECERAAFDVVVSDMRMPRMDGAALLEHIKNHYPSTVRIVLSGHAERQAVLRALSVAHQYLCKPCDADSVRSVIARACALQELMAQPELRAMVGRVQKLPSVPKMYQELTQVLAHEAPAIAEVARVIERDPAMCLKILQVVNSAFFGLPRRVTAIREAIMFLGIEPLKALVLVTQIFPAVEGIEGGSRVIAAIQEHSVMVARVARALIPASQDDAFMAGMLHDVGVLILALAERTRMGDIVESARKSRMPLHTVERENLGVTHADVGAYVLGTWGLPFGVVEAVAGHHEPERYAGTAFDTTTAVHVAEALVTGLAGEDAAIASPLAEEYLRRLAVLDKLAEWRAAVADICSSGGA
jgi:HD-like signal output (HDOD) protein